LANEARKILRRNVRKIFLYVIKQLSCIVLMKIEKREKDVDWS